MDVSDAFVSPWPVTSTFPAPLLGEGRVAILMHAIARLRSTHRILQYIHVPHREISQSEEKSAISTPDPEPASQLGGEREQQHHQQQDFPTSNHSDHRTSLDTQTLARENRHTFPTRIVSYCRQPLVSRCDRSIA
jgi:hypothetical protein